jgi:hypothetical protein
MRSAASSAWFACGLAAGGVRDWVPRFGCTYVSLSLLRILPKDIPANIQTPRITGPSGGFSLEKITDAGALLIHGCLRLREKQEITIERRGENGANLQDGPGYLTQPKQGWSLP